MQGLEGGGILIPHFRSFFMRIPHSNLFSYRNPSSHTQFWWIPFPRSSQIPNAAPFFVNSRILWIPFRTLSEQDKLLNSFSPFSGTLTGYRFCVLIRLGQDRNVWWLFYGRISKLYQLLVQGKGPGVVVYVIPTNYNEEYPTHLFPEKI